MVFFYLRKAIRDREDLHFILQTFLYSCIFPFGMMFYEVIFGAITPEYASAGRGGGARIRGEYADSMNYASFLVGSFLVVAYFFLGKFCCCNFSPSRFYMGSISHFDGIAFVLQFEKS